MNIVECAEKLPFVDWQYDRREGSYILPQVNYVLLTGPGDVAASLAQVIKNHERITSPNRHVTWKQQPLTPFYEVAISPSGSSVLIYPGGKYLTNVGFLHFRTERQRLRDGASLRHNPFLLHLRTYELFALDNPRSGSTVSHWKDCMHLVAKRLRISQEQDDDLPIIPVLCARCGSIITDMLTDEYSSYIYGQRPLIWGTASHCLLCEDTNALWKLTRAPEMTVREALIKRVRGEAEKVLYSNYDSVQLTEKIEDIAKRTRGIMKQRLPSRDLREEVEQNLAEYVMNQMAKRGKRERIGSNIGGKFAVPLTYRSRDTWSVSEAMVNYDQTVTRATSQAQEPIPIIWDGPGVQDGEVEDDE